MSHSAEEWAAAIAGRLADEWDGKRDFPEDAALLEEVLAKALGSSASECMRLVGTGVIEESYFEKID